VSKRVIGIGLSLLLSAFLVPFCKESAAADSQTRIIYYGDSLAAEAAPYLQSQLTQSGRATMVNRTYPGSSPCDWKPAVNLDLSRGMPQAVIIETFGNNISSCQLVGGKRIPSGSAQYWNMYKKDLTLLMNRFSSKTKIWLVAPPAAKNDLSGSGSAKSSHKRSMMYLMNTLAAARQNTWALDAGAAVEGPGGTYSPYLACLPLEACLGSGVWEGLNRVRALDGLHFCPTIISATIDQLRHCPVYASGAYRFATAQAIPIINNLGL